MLARGGRNVGQGIHLRAALEVEAEDVKLPEPRRKTAHQQRSETKALVVAAHNIASQSTGTMWACGGGGASVACECMGEAWQWCRNVRARARWNAMHGNGWLGLAVVWLMEKIGAWANLIWKRKTPTAPLDIRE